MVRGGGKAPLAPPLDPRLEHASLSKSIEFVSDQVDKLENTAKAKSDELQMVKAQLQSQQKQNSLLQKRTSHLEDRNLDLEISSRWHNIIIEALPGVHFP